MFFPVLQLFFPEKYLKILKLVNHGSFFIKIMLIFLIAFLAQPLGCSYYSMRLTEMQFEVSYLTIQAGQRMD